MGGVRSGPGAARTILLSHIISARPSKQPLMIRTFRKEYMELGSFFLFLQEQIKDINNYTPQQPRTPLRGVTTAQASGRVSPVDGSLTRIGEG